MRQVLQVAAATTIIVPARRRAPLGAGLQDPFKARIDDLATGTKHPRFDRFAGQGAADEPGTPFMKTDAAAITGQALNVQALLLAYGNLRSTIAAGRLEAQAAFTFLGHQVASNRPVER